MGHDAPGKIADGLPASAAHRVFVLTFLLFTAAWIVVPYLVASSPSVACGLTRNPWIAVACTKALPAAVRALPAADVVLVGDSTLATGIKAAKMTQDLGLSTFNLGLPGPVFYYEDSYVLSSYLASHPAPKLIVFYLAPWNLSVLRDVDLSWGEAATYELAGNRWNRLRDVYRGHWQRIIEYPAGITRNASLTFDPAGRTWHAASAQLVTDQGWFDLASLRQIQPMVTCTSPSGTRGDDLGATGSVADPDTAMIRELRQAFETPHTRVLIYAAPLPICDALLEGYQRTYADWVDNVEQGLPPASFLNDGAGVHPTAAGADLATDLLTTAVRRVLVAPNATSADSRSAPAGAFVEH